MTEQKNSKTMLTIKFYVQWNASRLFKLQKCHLYFFQYFYFAVHLASTVFAGWMGICSDSSATAYANHQWRLHIVRWTYNLFFCLASSTPRHIKCRVFVFLWMMFINNTHNAFNSLHTRACLHLFVHGMHWNACTNDCLSYKLPCISHISTSPHAHKSHVDS